MFEITVFWEKHKAFNQGKCSRRNLSAVHSALQWQMSSNVSGFNPWKTMLLCDAGNPNWFLLPQFESPILTEPSISWKCVKRVSELNPFLQSAWSLLFFVADISHVRP